jgi:CheY-like chemotaxis protein
MGKIVIVDDSRLARTFTASCLKKLAHEVEEVEPTSIFDVLKLLKEQRPDLLIMDFLMPNCPGTSLARVCHEDPDLKDMKVLVLTAHHDDDVTTRLKAMGVSDVLFKPVDPAELQAKVTALIP